MSENKNAAQWFVDRHMGEGRGENLAFWEADGECRLQTYAQLAQP
jgi:4-hydroxybenzoate-CoA ligase